MSFPDLFSAGASLYAEFRPTYPDALYQTIADLTNSNEVAWDCGTGNGQAARDLARHFEHVVASDASRLQIQNAKPAPRVTYHVATSESSGLRSASLNLTTVAQALHWFDHERFYTEVRRVSAAGAIFAAWSYGACHAGDDLEQALREFEDGFLGAYWSPQRRWVDEGYRTIPFPFEELKTPHFELRMRWSLSQLGGYLSSWSAVTNYRRARGVDPVAPFLERIVKLWGPPEDTRDIVWPLALRVGRVG